MKWTLLLLVLSLPTYATTYVPSQEQNQTSTSQSGDASVSIHDERPVSSAASLYLSSCQTGISAQGSSVGVAIANPDHYCRLLQQANKHYEAYKICKHGPERERQHKLYHEYIDKASRYLSKTENTSLLAEISKDGAAIALSWGVIIYLMILL